MSMSKSTQLLRICAMQNCLEVYPLHVIFLSSVARGSRRIPGRLRVKAMDRAGVQGQKSQVSGEKGCSTQRAICSSHNNA